MTTDQAGPWAMPSQQAVPGPGTVQPAETKRVSSAGYWISGLILLLGLGGAAIWFVVALVGAVSAPRDYVRIDIPGRLTTTLDARTYTIFYEYPSDATSTQISNTPDVRITGVDGAVVPLDRSFLTSSYTWNGREGRSIAQVDIPTAGAYTITVTGEPRSGNKGSSSYKIALGTPFLAGGVVGILGSVILGSVSLLVGVTVLVVTIVRRSGTRRARAPKLPPYGGPSSYPGPGAAYPGPYPPGTYPPQGYPPTGWPPPNPVPQPGWGPPAVPHSPPGQQPPPTPQSPPVPQPPPAPQPSEAERPGGEVTPRWPWSVPGEDGTTQQP